MLDTAEYLFPSDLKVTPTQINRILLIGSCLSDTYKVNFERIMPGLQMDRILFNNAQDLPAKSTGELSEYNLQYVQIPLRSVLTDALINAENLRNRDFIEQYFDFAEQNLSAMLEAAMKYNEASGILTIVSNFIVPQTRITPSLAADHTEYDITYLIERLNLSLARKIKNYNNTFYADVNAIASSLGKRYFLDDSVYFYSHGSVVNPYWGASDRAPKWALPERGRIEDVPDFNTIYEDRTQEYYQVALRQIEAIYRVARQIDMVKVVIFDLDNTLWRGQVGEHYASGKEWPSFHGWPLGVWEAVQQLRWRGIITSIASKNDHDVVEKRWNDVAPGLLVKLSDFVHPQINWSPKVENIAKILKAVNVTAKSAVFVDDNPVERESVKAAFPDIRTIGSNPFLTRRILLWAPETQVASATAESSRREDMIRKQIVRETEKVSMSREDFLKSLDCKLIVQELVSVEQGIFTRTLELVNKSNQFNTTGKRWAVTEIVDFLKNGGHIYTFSVRDRFVEYGLVGVVFVQAEAITQYVMSCRVLGMDIEKAMIAELVAQIRDRKNTATVVGRLIKTESNGPCQDLFSKCGFTTEDGALFKLGPKEPSTRPAHVKLLIEEALVAS